MASQFRTRGYSPGDLLHITVRGYRKKPIFLDEYDHQEFIDTFRLVNSRLPRAERLIEHADAQMANHQHRLVTNGESPVAVTKVMHSLQIRYAKYFNWRYKQSGKVFEKPFRARVIRGVEHTMNTFAYIHLNPDASLRTANSSHGVYAGLREDPEIDMSLALNLFGGRDGYLDYFVDNARVRAARASARRRLEW